PHETGAQLVEIELRAAAVLLHDLRHPQLHRLVGGKALVACRALAPAADRIAVVAHPGVNDLGIGRIAARAFHGFELPVSGFRSAPSTPRKQLETGKSKPETSWHRRGISHKASSLRRQRA